MACRIDIIRMFQILTLVWISQTAVLQAVETFEPEYGRPETEPWRWQIFDDANFLDAKYLLKASNGVLWVQSDGRIIQYDGIRRSYFQLLDDCDRGRGDRLVEGKDGIVYYCGHHAVYAFSDGVWKPVFEIRSKESYKLLWVAVLKNGEVCLGSNAGMVQLTGGKSILWVSELTHSPGLFLEEFDEVRVIGTDQVFDAASEGYLPEKDQVKRRRLEGFKCVGQEEDGSVWTILFPGKLYHFESNNAGPLKWTQYKKPKLITKHTRMLIVDGLLWFVGNKQANKIICFDPVKNHTKILDPGIPDAEYFSIAQSEDGTIWVGSSVGLLSYRNDKWNMVHNRDLPVPKAEISTVKMGKDGALWLILHKRGILRLDVSNKHWLSYEELHYQCTDLRGGRWFLFRRSVVRELQGRWQIFSNDDGLMIKPMAVFSSRSGPVWVLGREIKKIAVSRFDGVGWDLRLGEFEVGLLKQVVESADGNLWLADKSMKIFKYDGQKDEFFCLRPKVDGGWGLALDSYNRVVCGGTLSVVKDGEFKRLSPDGWIEDGKTVVAQAADGIWGLSERQGLFKLTDAGFTFHEGYEPLWQYGIKHMFQVEDKLWVNTEQGRCVFDGLSWAWHPLNDALRKTVNIQSMRVDKDHAIWINQVCWDGIYSGNREYQRVRTIRYRGSDEAPDTRIIQPPPDAQSSQKERLLAAWDGVDMWNETPADELYYSFRIDDQPWSAFTENKYHMFYDLPTGQRRLEVRTRDRDLNIDPTPAVVHFRIVGPVWSQSWFIGLMIFLLGFIVFLTIRLIRSHELRVTEQLAAEKEQARFRLEFFTNISHELRTPLTLILGPLEKIIKMASPDLREQAGIAQRSAKRLQQLINQLLDMRKLQEGKFQLQLVEEDIIGFVDELMGPFFDLAAQHSIGLKFEPQVEMLIVQFDRDKLEKILTNLISNALKFSPEESAVSVAVGADGPNLWITVKDHGAGIDPAYISKVFDRFVQAPSDGDGQVGTGIGLALTKDLVELHGGTISVESELGKGTLFRVLIPLTPSSQSEALSEDASVEESCDEKKCILVVEDHPDMRRFIRLELAADYVLLEAEDGEAGLLLAQKKMPDVVISDVMMPKLNGFELCRKLKQDLKTSHIPVILLTARGSQEAQVEGLETGADDYIVKPFNSRLLRLRIRNLLEARRKLQARFGQQLEVQSQKVTGSRRDAEFLEKAVRVVEDHLGDEGFSIETLASKMGISRTGLYQKLKAITGLSANVFIRSVRLKCAARMLAAGEKSVGEVAFETGFSSHSHFTRCFTKEFKVGPSQYLNSL